MGRLFALDPTQGQRYVGVLAATNPTDDDAHRTVDYYLETTTGYTAARVHDTDANSRNVVLGQDTPCPAAVSTWLTALSPVVNWREAWFWVTNTGANAGAGIEFWFYRDLAGAFGVRFQIAFAVAAGATYYAPRGAAVNEWLYQSSVLGCQAVRLAFIGGANPTTATGAVVMGR
jgi:hypothetical protein